MAGAFDADLGPGREARLSERGKLWHGAEGVVGEPDVGKGNHTLLPFAFDGKAMKIYFLSGGERDWSPLSLRSYCHGR